MARSDWAAMTAAAMTLLATGPLAAQSATVHSVARVLEPVGAARLPERSLITPTTWGAAAAGPQWRLTTRIGAPVQLSLMARDVAEGAAGAARRVRLLPPDRAAHVVSVPAGPIVVVVSYL
ncbi:MAG: hypothetical protein KC544_07875 [Gemmatimonadetes bacterium]|nr:hypothetical protein [Gemmatimonadota bacterium]MCA9763027.1 hypothetical protein [Gemmatimonadota bacterium]MCB9504699.1 hypothetical protein [Gemmatimonadales bacterium]HPF61039.1 hypothetical protein [Gemmatimonadales bacterium]